MSLLAFIYSSAADFPAARANAAHLESLGVASRIVLARREPPAVLPRDCIAVETTPDMFSARGAWLGLDAARLMLDVMLEQAGYAQWVARIDADTRVTPAGIDFLRSNPRLPVRALTWCGFHALPVRLARRVLEDAATAPDTRMCAGCWILRHARLLAGGTIMAARGCFTTAGKPTPDHYAATVPGRLDPAARAARLAALWDLEN